jgi:hypothetical protein
MVREILGEVKPLRLLGPLVDRTSQNFKDSRSVEFVVSPYFVSRCQSVCCCQLEVLEIDSNSLLSAFIRSGKGWHCNVLPWGGS